jgi:hypothetical protein
MNTGVDVRNYRQSPLAVRKSAGITVGVFCAVRPVVD